MAIIVAKKSLFLYYLGIDSFAYTYAAYKVNANDCISYLEQ